jgi:hypothetical protein
MESLIFFILNAVLEGLELFFRNIIKFLNILLYMMDDIIFQLVADAKSEKWASVDRQLPKIARNKEYAKWAYNEALISRDGNVRDLGASILEKAVLKENQFALMRDRLYFRMMNDSNPFARYRSAFALAAHGPGKYKDSVLRVLYKAMRDKDVKGIARRYVSELEHKN